MGPLPPVADLPVDELLQAIARDKKVVAGKLHFVLPTSIGSTAVATDVSPKTSAAQVAGRDGVGSPWRADGAVS